MTIDFFLFCSVAWLQLHDCKTRRNGCSHGRHFILQVNMNINKQFPYSYLLVWRSVFVFWCRQSTHWVFIFMKKLKQIKFLINVLMDDVKIERFLLLKMMNWNKNFTTNFLSSRSSLCLRNNQTCRIFVLICGLAFLLAETVSWLA